MKAAIKDLIYLYCITNKVPKLKEVENLADKLHFVYHLGLYAVVSKVKESEFSEEGLKKNLPDLEWIKVKAGIHEKVIEGIMRHNCVMPFKFATIFNTEDNLKVMLKEHAKEFKTNLKDFEGKEEWGVKIYCDLEKLKNFLIKDNDEILKIDKEIRSSSPGKGFILKKKKEELLKTTVNRKINEYSQDAFERLNKQSLQARINKLLPKEVTERENSMILNAAFLVDKIKVKDFVDIVNTLKAQYNTLGFFFDCTGPWPPYNFCQLSKEKMKNG